MIHLYNDYDTSTVKHHVLHLLSNVQKAALSLTLM